MGRLLAIGMFVFGCIVAFIGINTDYLLGGSPGISAPQLMLIISGFVIAVVGFVFIFGAARRWIRKNGLALIGVSLPTVILAIILLEFALNFLGMATIYPTEPTPDIYKEAADWWVCDELGCHYDTEARQEMCDIFYDYRSCTLNAQGFHDEDVFEVTPDLETYPIRVLMLGDSFVYGASANPGNSFVETLEAQVPEALVWNVSMPGAGTNQQAEWLQAFHPMMEPDLVIVGFFMNDYEDNGYPPNSYFWTNTAEGRIVAIRQYRLNDANEAMLVNDSAELYYRAYGVTRPDNLLLRAVGKTHIGSLLINSWRSAFQIQTNQSGGRQSFFYERTREQLTQIRQYADEHDIPVLILGIPRLGDVTGNTTVPLYQTTLGLLEEVGLGVLDSEPLLSSDHYDPPDVHWNTAGHQMIGAQLAACVTAFEATRVIDDCILAFETPVSATD